LKVLLNNNLKYAFFFKRKWIKDEDTAEEKWFKRKRERGLDYNSGVYLQKPKYPLTLKKIEKSEVAFAYRPSFVLSYV